MIAVKGIQLSFNCDEIKELAVKVEYIISEDEVRESTGVIIRPKDETDYFFVLTTKHSFKKRDEKVFSDVCVEELQLSDIIIIYDGNEKLEPFEIIDTECDLVVLVIKNSLCKNKNLKVVKVLDGQFTECGLVGYPRIANGEQECYDKCTHNITVDEYTYKINSNTVLQSYHKDEEDATKGYSGSGLFTQVKLKNYDYMLTGIVSEVIAHKNSFRCVNLSFALDKISLAKYGGIEIISLESPSIGEATQLHQEANQLEIDQLQIIIQEKVTKELEKFKEENLNGVEKGIREWIEEIKNSMQWKAITNSIKSEILYEEAKLFISDDKLKEARSTIEEINVLNPSRYTNRLLSWIEIKNDDLPKAVLLLDNNEASTLNQKAAIYISMNDFANTKKIIESIEVENKDHETYRVKAIYELYSGSENYGQALKEINKSLELTPDYIESKRVKAIILFYQATLFTVVPNLVPPIAQRDMLKMDTDSQKKIYLSKELLSEVVDQSPEFRDKAWIATILWLLNIDDAIEYIKQIYKDKIYKDIAIQFIIIYGLNIDIEKDIEAIELDKNSDLHSIDTVIRYHYAKQNKEKLFSLLEEYKDVYIKHDMLENWNENYLNALLKFELYTDALEFIDNSQLKEKDDAKAHIYKIANDYKSAYTIYEKRFKETNDPFYRLVICEMKSLENNWEYIAEYTDYLLENFQTEKVIELVVYAERNCDNCPKAKQLINTWFPEIKNQYIIDNFNRIKAYCENRMGFPDKAIDIYEKNDLIKTGQDFFSLAQLYKKRGSAEKIETLVIEHKDNPNIDVNTKIQVASMTKNSPIIIKEILDNNDIKNIDKILAPMLLMADSYSNEGIFNAVSGKKISQDLQELSNDETSQVWTIEADDLFSFIDEKNKQNEYNYNLYRYAKLPVHLIEYIFKQDKNKHIYIKGAKKFHLTNIENIKDTILYLDITSLLLLFDLNKLQKVFDSFLEVYLPANIFFILEDLQVSDKVINTIKINFNLKKIFYCPEVKNPKVIEKDNPSNILLSLATMLEVENKNESIVCVDDRFTNNYETTQSGIKIISTNDILSSFYQQEIINANEYYSTLIEMRKRDYLYVLITSEEIIYHLRQCHIRNDKLEESDNLKILKKSLIFMVQNFKYLKLFTQGEIQNNQYAEPFFVINQEREIHDSIIQLWNEKFEYEYDRYIHLSWIMENMFTLNMAYLIRNKLPHNNNLIKTMSIISISSLFVQAIRINSKSNQKLYFDWIYHNYFDRFFSTNFDYFEDFIKHIQDLIFQSLIKKDSSDIEKSIIINLILNLPSKIKECVTTSRKLQDNFSLHRTINIGKLSFNDRFFIDGMKKVVNGSRQEAIRTADEQSDSVLLKARVVDGKKEIEFIHNGEAKYVDDIFMVLSTSALKRKKLFENNPQWFDMSNRRKKKTIEKLNGIKIHYDRLEELHKVIENSSFYTNIEDNLKLHKLNFQDLFPKNINILLDHFRLDHNLPFDEALHLSTETLLDEESIVRTIDIIHHIPIVFPNKIIDKLSRESEKIQIQILKSFLKTSSSPISIIQMLRVVLEIDADRFSMTIRFLLKQLFTEKFKLEFQAFFTVLNYVKQEFNRRYTDLNNNMKLALIWAHTNKLMKYFNAYHIDYKWITENFKLQTNLVTLEIFKPDSNYSKDILNDNALNYERFIVASLIYAYDNDFKKAQGTFAKSKIEKIVEEDKSHIDLISVNVIMPNSIDSFLLIRDMKFLTDFPILETKLNEIDDFMMKSMNHNSILLKFLSLKYNTVKLSRDVETNFIEYIQNYKLTTPKFKNIIFKESKEDCFNHYNIEKFNVAEWYKNNKQEVFSILHDLLFMTKQLKNINNINTFKKVVEYIKNISEDITTEEEASALIESFIYLSAYRTDNLDKRIKLFVKYMHLCKKLQDFDITTRMIHNLLTYLPVEYANYFLLEKFENIDVA